MPADNDQYDQEESQKSAPPTILLVGAGSMGGALLRGWIREHSIARQSSIIDPNISQDLKTICENYGLTLNPDLESFRKGDLTAPDMIVFAIKPQLADRILPVYATIANNAVSISVMAGYAMEPLQKHLGGVQKIVRVMPNLPSLVGAGVSGLYALEGTTAQERNEAEKLMTAVGDTVWVSSEDELDMVTAVSGSGPAYYFLLTEALYQAGVAVGLKSETAARLARATATGSGKLLDIDQRSFEDLREAITSPGGTTAAALEILDSDDHPLRLLMRKAVKKAHQRAGELAKG